MEENKKRNKGLIVIVVILLIACIGMGCYIGYDKFLNNEIEDCKTTNDDNTKTKTNTEKPTENNNNNTYQVLLLSPIRGHAVVYNGEVYVDIKDTSSNVEEIYGYEMNNTLMKTREKYQEYSFGDLVMSVDRNNKWLKLNITNVKKIHNYEYGQTISNVDPAYGIIILNYDNSISYISTKDLIEGKNNTTKLDVTDIVDIVSEDNYGVSTYLVKSDGTKIPFSLN